MKRLKLSILATILLLASCAAYHEPQPSTASGVAQAPNGASDIGQLIYLAAQTMAERAGSLQKDRPIVVTTMVSINDLGSSSTFGRLASQLVANRLSQRGYLVKDLNYTRALSVREGTGELALSRDASRISAAVNAQAVVAGTYAVGGKEIYLNLRMLKADTGEIISSADVVIPLNRNTEMLIAAMN